MLTMKKAQGLSMNVIIIAAISLLVLVIISVLVLRAGGNVNRGTGCVGVGGQCLPEGPSCQEYGEQQGVTLIRNPSAGCEQDNMICCVPLGG